jgi:hypothetical protein
MDSLQARLTVKAMMVAMLKCCLQLTSTIDKCSL